MHTPWPIRRRVIARRDGARRGEAAYPVLRPWAMDHDAGTWPVPAHRQEASQGRRPVCPCLAHPATQPQTIAPPLARRRADGATPPEWPLAAAHLDRDDGYRGGQLHRPGLARRRDRAAWVVVERGRMRAPDRLARHDGQHRLPTIRLQKPIWNRKYTNPLLTFSNTCSTRHFNTFCCWDRICPNSDKYSFPLRHTRHRPL
jgi:hypothetical protein